MVELPHATRQAGKTETGVLLHFRQGLYYLTTVECKEFLPGSPLSHLYYRSRNKDLSWVSGMWIVAITISMVLLPCVVSSTWTWVNQLLTLVHDWDDTGIPPTRTSRLWVTWDIYEWDLLWHREAVLSGLGTFWKRSVSRSFLGVFLGRFGLLLVVLFFACSLVLFWRHLAFCSHLFSNMWELPIKDKTFWWPSEPRARTAWAPKKNLF